MGNTNSATALSLEAGNNPTFIIFRNVTDVVWTYTNLINDSRSTDTTNTVSVAIISTIEPEKVDKNAAELVNLNHCAVHFLSRADSNFSWYYSTQISVNKTNLSK